MGVNKTDIALLWKWANDILTRKMSFSSEPIKWCEHKIWFQRKIEDPNCHIYMALDQNGHPIGQIRFDIKNKNEAEIDVTLERNVQGKGLGSQFIKMGTDELFRSTSVDSINALIKVENIRSIRAFIKANFEVNFYGYINGSNIVSLRKGRLNGK